MARPPPPGRIPLGFRLPNPPDHLLGRDAEAQAISARLKAGPVAVIRGPSGIGKTALALAVTHAARKRRPETVRWLRLEAADPGPLLLRALAPPGEADADDWSALAHDRDGLWTAVLDLAEELGAWVVLDADDGEPPLEALALLARYARRSRWLVTTRATRTPEPLTTRLDPLDAPCLEVLAGIWAPDIDPIRRAVAVRAAAGSPGWLRTALSLAPTQLGHAETRGRLMAADPLPHADARAMALLVSVAAASTALPTDAAPACDAGRIARLERQGLIEPRPGGWAMHPAVRRLVGGATVADRRGIELALAARLGALDQPGPAVDATRIWLTHGRPDQAEALLDRMGPVILAAGAAPALWAVLAGRQQPTTWRLRAAIDSGDPEALAAVGPPPESDIPARLQWARVLSLRGEMVRAIAVADAVRAAAPETPLAHQATRVAARALMNAGRLAEGQARLEALTDPQPEDLALLLTCRAARGDPSAVDEARNLLGRLDLDRGAPDALRGALRLSLIFYRGGYLRDALQIFDALAERRPLALRTTTMRVVGLGLSLAAGRHAEARQLIETLRPLVGRSIYGTTVELAELALRIFSGELVGIEAPIERLIAAQDAAGRPELVAFAVSLADEMARLRCGPPAAHDPLAEPLRPLAGVAAPVRARLMIRQGQPGPALPATHHPEIGLMTRLAEADARLAAGDADGAAARADEARVAGHRQKLSTREMLALEVLAEAHLLGGRLSAVRETADRLAGHAAAAGAPRFAEEADWYRAVSEAPIDLARLEHLAGRWDVAPVAARRARALLGDDTVPLDVIDDRLLAALRARGPVVRGPAGLWQAGWGLDHDRKRVWLPDGRWVDLDGKETQWALLMALADGIEAKQSLVERIWHEPDYHPLRHDNRLHATVRLVRKALADDTQRRVETTEAGYRLGGVWRAAHSIICKHLT